MAGRIKDKIITIVPQTHDTYIVQGGREILTYADRGVNRKKAVRHFIQHDLQFNDVLLIKSDPHAHSAAQAFKNELQKQLSVSNPLNIAIKEGKSLWQSKDAEELKRQAQEKQNDILKRAHLILNKWAYFPYTFFPVQPTYKKPVTPYETVAHIQMLEEDLRTLQMISSFLFLTGVLLILISFAFTTPIILPLAAIAIGLTVGAATLLATSSAIGKKTGIFKNAEQTKQLSEDFLQAKSAELTQVIPKPALSDKPAEATASLKSDAAQKPFVSKKPKIGRN